MTLGLGILVLSGCAAPALGKVPTSGGFSNFGMPTLAPPSGMGVVVGGIDPCEGIYIPSGPRYAAGTVTVLRGVVTWQNVGPGVTKAVLPATVVAKQAVKENSSYRFTLGPGSYVLLGRYAAEGSNAGPFVQIQIRAGAYDLVDIPDLCM